MARYFGTDGIRGVAGQGVLTAGDAIRWGRALGLLLRERGLPPIVGIGQDTRPSGQGLSYALASGFLSEGIEVHWYDIIPSPGVSYLTKYYGHGMGVMVSASHNPYQDNGFKIFDHEGRKLSRQYHEMLESFFIGQSHSASSDVWGRFYMHVGALQDYISFILSTLSRLVNFTSWKVMVDDARGAAYVVVGTVLQSLGIPWIPIHGHNAPDGKDINDGCGALYPEKVRLRVEEESAMLGMALDGDGDRLMVVARNGKICDGDQVLALLAQALGRAGSVVVGTEMSNNGLDDYCASLGMTFKRAPRVGDEAIAEVIQETDAIIGGEPSGHIILPHIQPTGDGLVTFLQVMDALQKRGDIVPWPMFTPWNQVQATVPCAVDAKGLFGTQRVRDFLQELEEDPIGRWVARPSGTEPVIRLMVESEETSEGLQERMDDVVQKFQTFMQDDQRLF